MSNDIKGQSTLLTGPIFWHGSFISCLWKGSDGDPLPTPAHSVNSNSVSKNLSLSGVTLNMARQKKMSDQRLDRKLDCFSEHCLSARCTREETGSRSLEAFRQKDAHAEELG